jgi:MoaA/NifB/PqqE/SkfB family radical SAM enzyme
MLKALTLRLKDRNFLTLAKLAEVKLLGRYASTYCYNFPSHVLLELTARCNLRCVWCVQTHEAFRDENKEDMPFGLFERIIPKLQGAKVVYLNVNGEPLLYERIFDAVKLAKKYVPSVRLITNGTLLNREVCKDLKKAGLSQLGLSIDSPDEKDLLRIRNVSLAQITENLRYFCEKTNIPVEIRTAICEENAESLKDLPAFVSQFNNCHFIYFTLAEGIRELESSPFSMLTSKTKFLELKKHIVERCSEEGFRTNLEYLKFYPPGFFEYKRAGRCDSLFGKHLAINNKGYIMPCCMYWGDHLGNLGELSFDEAWNGERTRSWRENMLQLNYPDDCTNYCGYPRKKTKTCTRG